MSIENVEWEIKQEGPGMVRIIPVSLGKIPTLEQYKQKAKELLGFKIDSKEMLLDGTMNADIGETLLLKKEFDEKIVQNKKIHEIIFSYLNGDVMVNSKNIDSVFDMLLTNSEKLKQLNQSLKNSGICLEEIRI